MHHLLMLAVGDPTSSLDIFSALLAWGPGGVVVILFIFRWIEPRASHIDVVKEKDSWKEAFEKEQQAHQHTREALAKAEERADVAMDIAKPALALLQNLGHSKGEDS